MVTPKFSPVLSFLSELEVLLPPVEIAGVQVFGVRREALPRRISRLPTLGDHQAGRELAVREMDLHRGPPSVWLMNGSNRRIFVPAGERLPGPGTGRRLRASLVLDAQETLKLEPGLLEVEPAASLEEKLPGLSRLSREATGAVFSRGGRILGLDLFERKETLRRLLPGILSRRARGGGDPAGEDARAVDVPEVKAWLERASGARADVRPSLGLGREALIEDQHFRGRCLLLDEGLVHAEIDQR